ncbi:MAG: FtsX-like permease family protein [Acidobacteria bacterium]|nr:FtsX-like permease family protein [Acidobacteriota bacterium]
MSSRFPVENQGLSFSANSFFQIYSAPSRPFLIVLLAAVGLVLGMACLNAANLLLVRSLGRQQDLTVRLALGAKRADIAMQQLTESMVLAFLAAGLGLLLARWWMKILYALVADRLPASMTIDLDARVIAFTFVITLLSRVAAAVLPILTNTRGVDLASQIRQGGRSLIGSGRSGFARDLLIGAQVAMAVALLSGAALLIRGFIDLQNQDKGFSAESISTFRVALGWKRYISQDLIASYYERAQRELAARPEFSAVAFGHAPPLTGQESDRNQTILVQGQSLEAALSNPFVQLQTISENYLSVLGIRLLEGRTFSAFDRKDSSPVAIISKRLASRLFPNGSAIGQRIALNVTPTSTPVFREIVGVAESTQRESLSTVNSQDVFLSYRQVADANHYFLIRTSLPLNEFQSRVEQTLWAIDSQQSLFDVRSYESRVLDGIWQLRLSQYLLVIFGGVALVLAAIGIYSLMSYFVAMQKKELGVRLALGAQPSVGRPCAGAGKPDRCIGHCRRSFSRIGNGSRIDCSDPSNSRAESLRVSCRRCARWLRFAFGDRVSGLAGIPHRSANCTARGVALLISSS